MILKLGQICQISGLSDDGGVEVKGRIALASHLVIHNRSPAHRVQRLRAHLLNFQASDLPINAAKNMNVDVSWLPFE